MVSSLDDVEWENDVEASRQEKGEWWLAWNQQESARESAEEESQAASQGPGSTKVQRPCDRRSSFLTAAGKGYRGTLLQGTEVHAISQKQIKDLLSEWGVAPRNPGRGKNLRSYRNMAKAQMDTVGLFRI